VGLYSWQQLSGRTFCHHLDIILPEYENTDTIIQVYKESYPRSLCLYFRLRNSVKFIKVFLPTDAQLDSLKNNFKFALKLT